MSVENQISVIGKILLNDEQRNKLIKMGAVYIPESNPHRYDIAEIVARIGSADIILNNISTPITVEVMDACPHLKFIQTWSTGTDNIDLDEARRRGIKVANVSNFSTESVAEKTIGLMIFAAHRFEEAHAHAQAGGWDYQLFKGRELFGKTLCVVGYGNIGKRVTELARAFGMKVIPIHQKSTEKDLDVALTECQFLSLHCPLTNKTRHFIGSKQFSLMRDVIVINNSRGGVVDESALLSALNEKRVKYVTMDVFENEPPPVNHPLLHHQSVYVTPHFAWNTEESVSKLTDTAISNIEMYINKKLENFIV